MKRIETGTERHQQQSLIGIMSRLRLEKRRRKIEMEIGMFYN